MHFLHLLFNENNGGNRNGKGKMTIVELLLRMAQNSESDSGLFTNWRESVNKIPTDPKAPKLKLRSVKHAVLATDHSYQKGKNQDYSAIYKRGSRTPLQGKLWVR